MMKLPDWRERLIAYMSEHRHDAAAFGIFDCALFIAGAVEAQTGVDYGSRWVGRYTTEMGGQRVLKRAGHAGYLGLIRSILTEIPVAYAQEGDVAIVKSACGIVQGAGIYVLVAPAGIGVVPLLTASHAFRVG